MYEGGVPGNFSYISRPPPSLKRVFLYDFFCKIKRLPEEVGGGPHTFSVFGFKSLFRKRWGGGFKYFLLLPNDSAAFLRKLNATNLKAS